MALRSVVSVQIIAVRTFPYIFKAGRTVSRAACNHGGGTEAARTRRPANAGYFQQQR